MVKSVVKTLKPAPRETDIEKLYTKEADLADRLRVTIETQSALLQKMLERNKLDLDLAEALEDAASQYQELSYLIATRHSTLLEIEVLTNERDACVGSVEKLIQSCVGSGSRGS